MSNSAKAPVVGKILYGFGFVVALPVLLVFWAGRLDSLQVLPSVVSLPGGIILAAFGAIVMMTGIASIMMYGKGLPMNLFPPKLLVDRGIYRFLHHPIYVGFCCISVGVSLAAGSPGGLWIISPIVMLGCTALVGGYENSDMLARFGPSRSKPIIRLPADEDRLPSFSERISVYVLVLGPWVILYEAIVALGIPHDARTVTLPFEKDLPVLEWTEIFYASTYLFVFLVPVVGRSARVLRTFCVAGLAATGVGIVAFVVIPLIAPPRDFMPQNFLGRLLQWERLNDTAAAAFPSFHVAWAVLSAYVYARTFVSWRRWWWGYSIIIAASCITTGMHALADVVAGVFLAWMGLRIETLWELIRKSAEHISNSWKEWRFGPVRIINHGMYAGAGTFLGLALIGILIGADHVWEIQIVAFCSLIASGLWAQFIEGSPSLLRPYGYYGGVVGIVLGVFIVYLLGGSVWLLLSGFAVAGPFIQLMGRLRCLVQGCCHGRPASAHIGISYTHPRSRVTRLTSLAGVPIHPTPLYSILWNVVVGLFLVRLWFLGTPLPLIAGLYLILNGLGRFVEEAYRGEPQTPILGNLRLYQIMAIASVLSGIALTMMRTSFVTPSPQFSGISIVAALCFGFVTWFALGVDFPNSNRRFARLA